MEGEPDQEGTVFQPNPGKIAIKGHAPTLKHDAPAEPTGKGKSEQGAPNRRAFKDVNTDPPLRRYIYFEQAHMLATMPRLKVGETFQGALWAAVATASGAIAGSLDLAKKSPTGSVVLDVSAIVAFAVCISFMVAALLGARNRETAVEYLRNLYGIPPKSSRPRGRVRRWWHKCFD
jgi:hypothetical protein